MPIDICVSCKVFQEERPRSELRQFAETTWIYGHRPKRMIFCNDGALRAALGDRYPPLPRVPAAYQDIYSYFEKNEE
jgi:hypothetical protein